MTITLLTGAASYPLNEDAARWLVEAIRERCIYDTGHPRDINARACLQLADVIAEDLERGTSPEPIELGSLQVEGLLGYVFRHNPFRGNEELTTVYWGLRRFRGDPV